MFRIRQVPDDSSPANAEAVRQVQAILRAQFPGLNAEEIDGLPAKLRDPLKYRFRPILLVAENAEDQVRGFAMLLHAPDLKFCYLDFIATLPGRAGGGIGGALYERVRDQAARLDVVGLFFECLPDDPALSPDPETRQQNADRLRFYERWGARPIANTAYETPVTPGGDNPPYLVLDPIDRSELPSRAQMRGVIAAILERKYGELCPPEYNRMVIDSIVDDPVQLRPPRYVKARRPKLAMVSSATDGRIPLIINAGHDIHHVRERGYVEAPVRVAAILRELDRSNLFTREAPRHFAERHIRAVHDGQLVDYLRRACAQVGTTRSVYPYVFPVRNAARPPNELPLRAGYFCIDTFTPINGNAWPAALGAVDCALTAAERVLTGVPLAYALVRPPGHHAERRAFGGFCYFNNAAVAAHFLSRYGRVAVLDIDYHHGNGTQDIFYQRNDVLTVSLHGHPSFAYPYFSGFRDEEGVGPGAGYNLNLPLPEKLTPEQYREALQQALRRVVRHRPTFLVLAAGFDTAAGDPTGSWSHRRPDFRALGERIGMQGWPTLVVQEGGYHVRTLGGNVRAFFEGLAHGAAHPLASPAPRTKKAANDVAETSVKSTGEILWRDTVTAADADSVRGMTLATGVFSTDEVAIAVELVQERLQKGPDCGYHFVMAEQDGKLAGYACYGPIPGTDSRHDLYWVVVDPTRQRDGLGSELLRRTEAAARSAGATHMFVDTSGRIAYAPAREFYRRNGYRKIAELDDFFRDGDAKIIFSKRLSQHS